MRRDTLRRLAEEATAKRLAARATQREVNLRILQRAAVDAEKLTQLPEWDVYLQQVQAMNAADTELLQLVPTASEMLTYQTAEQCQRTEFERALIRARIQARNECIEIPKRIVQGTAESGTRGS